MDVEIIDEDENPMLHRTDVRFQLTHDEATPSRLSVRDSLAAKLNKDAGEVVVHQLDTKYGMRKTVGYAKVYEDADAADDVEQRYMLERNKIAGDGEAVPEDGDEPEADTDEPEAEDAEEPEEPEADDAEDSDHEAETDEADSDDAEDADEADAEAEAEAEEA